MMLYAFCVVCILGNSCHLGYKTAFVFPDMLYKLFILCHLVLLKLLLLYAFSGLIWYWFDFSIFLPFSAMYL